ncbi:PASTA domain-containing protein, partial [Kocuria rhizosphaericola]|uniref:PASTA domain-containing protein n=1 Tax=Kocuria rhizosphaericola TaxID=3376284 RepID=UPI00378B02FF
SGHVVSTEPAAGTKVRVGDTVTLKISLGPVAAPSVVVGPSATHQEASAVDKARRRNVESAVGGVLDVLRNPH